MLSQLIVGAVFVALVLLAWAPLLGVVGGVVAGNLVVPGMGALAALWVLPGRGYWTPDSDGLSGRFALGLGVVWYAIVVSIAFLVIGLAVMFANLPT